MPRSDITDCTVIAFSVYKESRYLNIFKAEENGRGCWKLEDAYHNNAGGKLFLTFFFAICNILFINETQFKFNIY